MAFVVQYLHWISILADSGTHITSKLFFISLKSKIDKTASFSPVHVFNQENESEIKKIFLFTILREYELCSSLKEGDNVSNVDAFSY